jgi:large subunit ribosomal protein L15
MRRAPKFGFNNKDFRNEFEVINLSAISKFSGEVTPETLKKAGLITGRLPVKVLAKGEIKTAVTVKADKFSKAAQAAIEKAGGKVEVLGAK